MSCFRVARWTRVSPTTVYNTEFIAQAHRYSPPLGDHDTIYSPSRGSGYPPSWSPLHGMANLQSTS